MARRNKTSMRDITEAFESTATIEKAAKFIGVTRSTLYNWINDEKEILELAEAQRKRREVSCQETEALVARVPKSIKEHYRNLAKLRDVTLSQVIVEKLGEILEGNAPDELFEALKAQE